MVGSALVDPTGTPVVSMVVIVEVASSLEPAQPASAPRQTITTGHTLRTRTRVEPPHPPGLRMSSARQPLIEQTALERYVVPPGAEGGRAPDAPCLSRLRQFGELPRDSSSCTPAASWLAVTRILVPPA